jgi:hypothetical protein
MKTLALILTLLVLTACGKTQYHINPEFTQYTATFTQLTHFATPLDIDFGLTTPTLDGLCTIEDGKRSISINEPHWLKMNPGAKEQLMLHELGHCVLGLKHDDTLIDTKPASIMYYQTFGHMSYYSSNRDYYLDQYVKSAKLQ